MSSLQLTHCWAKMPSSRSIGPPCAIAVISGPNLTPLRSYPLLRETLTGTLPQNYLRSLLYWPSQPRSWPWEMHEETCQETVGDVSAPPLRLHTDCARDAIGRCRRATNPLDQRNKETANLMQPAQAVDASARTPDVGAGLTSTRAHALLAQLGPNDPADGKRVSAVGQFLDTFRSPLVLILLAAPWTPPLSSSSCCSATRSTSFKPTARSRQ